MMRIQRYPYRSRLTFRKRRRRAGCLSLAVFVSLLVGVVTLSWNWVERRLSSSTNADSPDEMLTAAQDAFNRGDLDTTVTLTRQILATQPDQETALVLLARALVYRSYTDYNRAIDREAALELTTDAAQRKPGRWDVMAAHAFALQAAGNFADAADEAQRVLDHDPNDSLARTALALAYGGAGSFETSLRESQQAVQSADGQLDSRRALAISYGDVGNYPEAIIAVEQAIHLNNRLIPLYFERALYALQIGDADAATVAYNQVLAIDPNNVKVRLRLCELSSLLRQRDQAVHYCQDVTTMAPSWADGWYQLGREYFLQGNFQNAEDDLHRCSSLQVMQNVPVSERRFECWYLQGQAAEILGDCPNLVATYNEFREMASSAEVRQTWTYPPEGPAGCLTPESGGSGQGGG